MQEAAATLRARTKRDWNNFSLESQRRRPVVLSPRPLQGPAAQLIEVSLTLQKGRCEAGVVCSGQGWSATSHQYRKNPKISPQLSASPVTLCHALVLLRVGTVQSQPKV